MTPFKIHTSPALALLALSALLALAVPRPLAAQPAAAAGPETDVGQARSFEDLLAQKDGAEFQFEGRTYVWRDGVPFEKNPDGSLAPLEIPENLFEEQDGENWLTQDADGSIYINVSPRIWASIRFEYRSDEISPESRPILDAFGKSLGSRALSKYRLIIAGHTDSVGSEEYNLGLSRRRARSVAHYLTETHGIAPERLILHGYGLSRPIADNATMEGRAVNRRVEFILIGPPGQPEEPGEYDKVETPGEEGGLYENETPDERGAFSPDEEMHGAVD